MAYSTTLFAELFSVHKTLFEQPTHCGEFESFVGTLLTRQLSTQEQKQKLKVQNKNRNIFSKCILELTL